jgi:phage-related protein
MPATLVLFYREGGEIPALDWFDTQSEMAQERVAAAIERLADLGHELRRPHVENLGEGIYELRVPVERVQHRLLFFFHGRGIVLLAHGFTKEREIPAEDLRRAKARKERFEANPGEHTAEVDV